MATLEGRLLFLNNNYNGLNGNNSLNNNGRFVGIGKLSGLGRFLLFYLLSESKRKTRLQILWCHTSVLTN